MPNIRTTMVYSVEPMGLDMAQVPHLISTCSRLHQKIGSGFPPEGKPTNAAAESVRQDRKRQEVARRMDRFNTTQQSLTSSFATPSYFTVDFTNPYGQQATFNVHVLARGEKPQPPPEILPSVPPQAPLQGVGA